MRYLMDVIGLDATVVRGSHGRPTDREEDGPLFITTAPELLARQVRARRFGEATAAGSPLPGRDLSDDPEWLMKCRKAKT